MVLKLTTLEARIADMGATSVELQVASVSPTQYCYYTLDDRDMAEAVATAERPERLAGFASVSLQFPDLASCDAEVASGTGSCRRSTPSWR